VMTPYAGPLGESHTPAAFLAVAGQALAYDITDTVASFLFGLAFAPELARVLARMRARMDVTWVQAPPLRAVEERGHRRGDRALGAAGSLAALAVAATLLLGGAHATAGPASQARPVP